MIRRSAVAGSFYAGTRDSLRLQVEGLLPKSVASERAIGLVAPHAGYVYSGRVAGAVYSRVEFPETFVILGPNHTGLGAAAAIMTDGEWETPLGKVSVDTELGKAILANSPMLEEDHLGHLREHSIEVQLPFLQWFDRPFRFVPICLLSHLYATCREVGWAVARAVQTTGRRVVLVASTDMSHYVPRSEATAKDRKAIEAIMGLDPEGLYQVVRREGISMCGFHPTTAMLVAATALGASRGELVMYTDSGEVTRNLKEVVAYAGLIIR
jgi:AmmeMemoRadiSam system protein B